MPFRAGREDGGQSSTRRKELFSVHQRFNRFKSSANFPSLSIHQYIINGLIIIHTSTQPRTSSQRPNPDPDPKPETRSPLPTPSRNPTPSSDPLAHIFKAYHTRIHRNKLEVAFFMIHALSLQAVTGQPPANTTSPSRIAKSASTWEQETNPSASHYRNDLAESLQEERVNAIRQVWRG